MSLFKRKGRRIATGDNGDDGSGNAPGKDQGTDALREDESLASPQLKPTVRFGKRPSKPSSLRRSVVVGEGEEGGKDRLGDSTSGNLPTHENHDDSDDDTGPVVVRPTFSRTGSARPKKRQPTTTSASLLSFGTGDAGNGDADEEGDTIYRAPRRKARVGAGAVSSSSAASLAPRVLETSTFRKALSGSLPTGMFSRDPDDDSTSNDRRARADGDSNDADDGDDGRPRYSQAYLAELQSATPNRPPERANDTGAMDIDLDPSELEGALVVDASELAPAPSAAVPLPVGVAPPSPTARVLTATEIQERKDRRARRALEQEAAALQLGSDDDEAVGYISLLPEDQKQKKRQQRKGETRLVREDEDLGEGFEQFVEDEQLAFGRKAERAARRQRKNDMAALINAAEADDGDGLAAGGVTAKTNMTVRGGDVSSSDSEAERRAAYDAAQTRAGMGGSGMQPRRLRTTVMDDSGGGDGGSRRSADAPAVLVVPKMNALPDLADCLARMKRTVQALADEAAAKRAKLAAIEREKEEIAAREAEVQAVLDAAAQKYQALLGTKGGAAGVGTGAAAATLASAHNSSTQSPVRAALPLALSGAFPAERGLESLGTTPVQPRANAEDEL